MRRHKFILDDRFIRFQNHDILGQPGAIRIILWQNVAEQFDICYQGGRVGGRHNHPDPPKIGSTSPLPRFLGSGTGDENWETLLWYLVANLNLRCVSPAADSRENVF